MTEATAAGWDSHVHVFDAQAPVRAGHYQPVHRPLQQVQALAAQHGVGHLVLVQPSVYGHDNRLLLQALRRQPGRHRGVVVLADGVDDATLADMHAAGVRGARLNRVSPVGEASADPMARLQALAPRLHALGWHLQWYATPAQLPGIAAWHADGPQRPVCVLDHLAGLTAASADDAAAWRALQTLADLGAWVKLSGWYRLAATAPYAGLLPLIQRVAALFGDHLVWGSDWPHTSFAPDQMPAYDTLWTPVVQALGPARAQALRQRQPALYR